MTLRGKTVLITGASEGIGAACAAAFRRRGARLSLVARNEENLRQVAGPDEVITAGDLTEAEVRRRAVGATIERFGALDVLVNNAGVGLYAPTAAAPMTAVRRMWELNVFAPLELTQLAVPHMERQGGGVVVNVGSIAGKVTLPWMTLYSVSKFALNSLTDGLRMELKAKKIHAIAVCPGYVTTHFQDHVLGGRPSAAVQRSRMFSITAGQCAKAIVRAVEKEKRTVVIPAAGWLLAGFARLFPAILDWQLERIYRSVK
jgi:short-subunit dehydrogenase